MPDDGVLRRFPSLLLPGNGIIITPVGNGYRIGADPDALMVTPTDAGAPMALADLLALLVAHDSATRLITTLDDGFFDVPGTAGHVSADDGNF